MDPEDRCADLRTDHVYGPAMDGGQGDEGADHGESDEGDQGDKGGQAGRIRGGAPGRRRSVPGREGVAGWAKGQGVLLSRMREMIGA